MHLEEHCTIIYTAVFNLLALGLGTVGNDHLGWGPDALTQPCVDPSDDDGTRFPYSLTESGCFKQDTEDLPLDNHHLSADIPVYYYVFQNCDGTIEINYRFFAYRDDIAFPGFLRGVISDCLGGHWSDWEPNITIVLNDEEVPLYTYYSAHNEEADTSRVEFPIDSPYQPRYLLWDDVRKDAAGHPVVLIAAKKHGTYYSALGHSVPNLDPLTSPSPTNPSALMRPQFLNFALNLPSPVSFLGYAEDHVGESWIFVPFIGEVYLAPHWIPTSFVNLETQLWRLNFTHPDCGSGSSTGKWGQSEDSGCTPTKAQHGVRDFVGFYRRLNALPADEQIAVQDYYSPQGPVYDHDLDLGGDDSDGPYFHNIYYSILSPLGFGATQAVYDNIRFLWWNDLSIGFQSSGTDYVEGVLRSSVSVSNAGQDVAYGFGLKARLPGGAPLARSIFAEHVASGNGAVVELDVPLGSIPLGHQVLDVEVFGPADFGPEPGTGRLRAVDAPIDSMEVPVNRTPIADAGQDQILECTGQQQAAVTLDGSHSSDPDSTPGTSDDIVSFVWSEGSTVLATGEVVTVPFAVGTHTLQLTVTDAGGAKGTDSAVIIVTDTIPPSITIQLDKTTLWPPNHSMVPINVRVSAHDTCGATSFELLAVTSSEPEDGRGDGNTSPDIQGACFGTPDTEFQLRAERSGNGGGRIYLVRYRAFDKSGNHADADATVTVPKSR